MTTAVAIISEQEITAVMDALRGDGHRVSNVRVIDYAGHKGMITVALVKFNDGTRAVVTADGECYGDGTTTADVWNDALSALDTLDDGEGEWFVASSETVVLETGPVAVAYVRREQ